MKPFDEEVKCGKYYIESKHGYPLRSNGWYYWPLAQYCLDENIIQLTDIKYQFLPTSTLKSDSFNKIVTVIDEHFEDVSKLAVNTLIGCLAKTINSITQSHFSESVVEAGHFS